MGRPTGSGRTVAGEYSHVCMQHGVCSMHVRPTSNVGARAEEQKFRGIMA